MSARATAYPPPGSTVRIPEPIWQAALEEVRRYAGLPAPDGTPGCEGLVYLGGIAAPDELLVTSLLRPRHAPQGDRVATSPTEVRWLLDVLRSRDEKLVAQLHSHRHGAEHSPGDDRMATSFHEGFLSIVVPDFGTGITHPEQCGVHEYDNGEFRRLSDTETLGRISVFSLIVDRQPPQNFTCPDEKKDQSRWARFVQKLRSIAPR